PYRPCRRARLEIERHDGDPAELVLPGRQQGIAALAGLDVDPELGAGLRPRRRPAEDRRKLVLLDAGEDGARVAEVGGSLLAIGGLFHEAPGVADHQLGQRAYVLDVVELAAGGARDRVQEIEVDGV